MTSQPSAEMQGVIERTALRNAGLPDSQTLPAAEGRAQAIELNRHWNRDLPAMEVREFSLPGGDGQPVTCRLYLPDGRGTGTLLHLHGGGWAFCNLDTHEQNSRRLAVECGMAVLSVDYRLAPEHPFPAGLDDCRAVWRALHAGDAALGEPSLSGPYLVAGDSAGSNLALALILAEQAEGRAAPDAGLLFYGVYDADFATASFVDYRDGPGLTAARMIRFWNWYTTEAQRTDPLAAPLQASDAALRALPPLLVTACAIDPLRTEAEAFHARLTALGRSDPFHLHEGVIHGFMQMPLELDEARAAFRLAGRASRELVTR